MLLKLLSRSNDGSTGSIIIDDTRWELTTYDPLTTNLEDVTFTCISYAWGLGRVSDPFHPAELISDRTIPALRAVISLVDPPTSIWIDAFCVPKEGPGRLATLESMGFIYSQAQKVIVVLSNAARTALLQISPSKCLDTEYLDVLECEPWSHRAWTYQEAVNSKQLSIMCEDSGGLSVNADDFFNCLGNTLLRLDNAGLFGERRSKYPRLNAIEDLLADWRTADFLGRSALQVMSNLDRRVQHRDEDHFYAMIGAISNERASSAGTHHPCETFMSLCERKGDYSFIYSAADRDIQTAQPWRPVPDDLPSILPWHSWGERQPGHWESEKFYLDAMMVLRPQPIDNEARAWLRKRLITGKLEPADFDKPLEEAAYDALRMMGFRGWRDSLPTKHGLFFPYKEVSTDQNVEVLASTTIRWTLGAPGLARYSIDPPKYMSGVFFGPIDDSTAVSVRMS